MCGIAGIVAPEMSPEALEACLSAMVGSLVHRGPDADGTFVHAGAGIGSRRLAIIDLVTGDQPIPNEDRDVWVVQNGEIYNHVALRKQLEAKGHRFRSRSDTEVLVHGWEEWGTRLPEMLNGIFAFAVWDLRNRQMFLARDRFGVKPLYWARTREGAFLFASELKAMIASGLLDPEMDHAALGQYLFFEYVPAPRSILQRVSKLEAGHWLTLDDDAQRIHPYWDMNFVPDPALGGPRARTEIFEALEDAVRLELISDVPVGVLLSGGIDSSAVALAASRISAVPPKTFTIGFEESSFDEAPYARAVAQSLGTEHHETILSESDMGQLLSEILLILDEPLADSSIFPTYLLSQFARKHVKVALGGDGGDELWAGYPTIAAHRVAFLYRRLPRWLRERIIAPSVNKLPTSLRDISLDFRLKRFVSGADEPDEVQHQLWLGAFGLPEIRNIMHPDISRQLSDEAILEPIARLQPKMSELSRLDRLMYMDVKLYLEGDILTKVDRASMACSLEVRVPLLNPVFAEVASRVPTELKLRGMKGKTAFRESISPMLPRTVSRRGKKGFNIPMAQWLRGKHRELLDALLDDVPPELQRRPLEVLVADHLRGRRDNRKVLWPLIVFRGWRSTWMVPHVRRP